MTSLTFLRGASFAVLCTLLAACGGGSSSSGSGSSDSNATGIGGSWSGEWLSASTNRGELAVTLNVSGNAVSGPVTRHTISACTLTSFSGTFSGNTLSGTFRGNGNDTSYTAKLEGNRLSGSYRVMSGGCAGDTGTITMNR